MERMTINYVDANGNKIPVEIKVNKKLTTKSNKEVKNPFNNTRLKAAIAATAVVLSIGSGVVLSGCSLFNQSTEAPTKDNNTSISNQIDSSNPIEESVSVEENEINEELRFNPNSKESIIENAVFLIEEAARCGKELDAEDAVLSVIATNSNELSAGFMGELFGERADQTYTADMIVDAYLKTCLIQLETIGVSKDNDIAFNIENVFASKEDHEYLNIIRDLTFRFNNSTDETERNQIVQELNQIAFELTTSEVNDIGSPAGVLAMLSLDGMRVVTNNMENPVLHDDIRDEMFGNGSYSCSDEESKLLQTAYSNRVSDLKLDSIKEKLDNAVLLEGKTVILDDIIMAVKEQTKNVQISDFDVAAEINKILNSYVDDKYKNAPIVSGNGSYSENTTSNGTKPSDTTQPTVENTEPKIEVEIPAPEVAPDAPEITPTIINPEVTTPTAPEITIEENVTPEPDEEVIDTGDVEQNQQEAIEKVEEEWQKAQEDSNKGSTDGMAYGLAGSAKPSFSGKSQYYINAFNASYDVYYQIYLDAKAQEEEFANEQIVEENTTTQETIDETIAGPEGITVEEATETVVEEVQEAPVENTEVVETDEISTTTVTYDLNNLSVDQLEELRNAAIGAVTETEETEKEYTK